MRCITCDCSGSRRSARCLLKEFPIPGDAGITERKRFAVIFDVVKCGPPPLLAVLELPQEPSPHHRIVVAHGPGLLVSYRQCALNIGLERKQRLKFLAILTLAPAL